MIKSQSKERSYKKKLTKSRIKDFIFVAILLAYPIAQFVITWAYVNIGSLVMAFQRRDIYGNVEFCGFDQFISVIDDVLHSTNTTGVSWLNNQWVIILNSLGYAAVTIFISVPLSVLFSYFLQKKMPLANVFRVIFFLPNIIPIVALTLAYNMPINAMTNLGYFSYIYSEWPKSQLFVYLYCIWAGLGYNVVLLSGAIGRIPKELFESAQIDGAGYFVEFTKITIPLIWSTIVTLIILGMTNVLTLYLQPYLLANDGDGMTYSIAQEIFDSASSNNTTYYPYYAAKGLLFSAIWAPIVLLVRNRLSKKYDGLDF